MIRKHFKGYNFVGIPETGVTFRWGECFSENPYSAPWPEIVDISISNYCTNGCEHCYRSSDENGEFMSIEDYRYVLNELSNEKYGKVFQVALGGGEPLLHPDFNKLLEITREEFGIIPNYTTCGKFFNQDNLKATRKYCGAAAISWDPYRENLSLDELSKLGSRLLSEDIRTNLHYVVSEKTLPKSLEILKGEYDEYLKSYNSIIFLTFKPTGRAGSDDVIKSASTLKSFLDLVENPFTCLNIGFDACFVPVLMKNTNVDVDFLDSCECGFFSVYIDEELNVKPCSFCNNNVYSYNLKQYNFENVWHDLYANYRNYIDTKCKSECVECNKILDCRGRCPFFDELFLCNSIR
jgi:radical SAM protein with 4Fe4S-binding SPASM domain